MSASTDFPKLPDTNITEISVDINEALRYLHHHGQPLPPELSTALAAAAKTVIAEARPRCTWRLFSLKKFPIKESDPQIKESDSQKSAIYLDGTNINLLGQAISNLLQDCDYCLLLAATLGQKIDDIIRRTQISDISTALLLDACASAAIEDLCDRWQTQMSTALQPAGYALTTRFSPGYADLPLSLQKPLCAVLDTARRIGLTVSSGCILLPHKSVTAIVGITTTKATPPADPCSYCLLRDTCDMRRSGQPCGRHSLKK